MTERVIPILLILMVAAPAVAQATRAGEPDPRLAQAWRRASHVESSRYYLLRSDLDRDDTVRVAAHMDRMCNEYAVMLTGLRPRRTNLELRIMLFRTYESYLSSLEHGFGANAAGTGGMTIRDGSEITIAAWRGRSSMEMLERVLRHEGFHQFAQYFFPKMPRWAEEGMAEVFGAAVVLNDGFVLGEVEPGHLHVVQEHSLTRTLIPFDTLFGIDGDEWNAHLSTGSAGLQYAEAWSVVHFLIYGEGGLYLPTFQKYLAGMNRGNSSQAAFAQAFGRQNVPRIAERWLGYADSLAPTDYATTIARLEFLAAGLLALRRAGVEPTTFEALESALREESFAYATGRFGIRRELAAADASVFSPAGGGDATFVLRELKTKRSYRTPKQRRDDERNNGDGPVEAGGVTGPPTRFVFTRGHRPREFGIVWTVDRKTGGLHWELRPEAAR